MTKLRSIKSSDLIILISMILLVSSISIASASIYILDADYFHEFVYELNPWDKFGPHQGSAARVGITDLIPDNANVRAQIAREDQVSRRAKLTRSYMAKWNAAPPLSLSLDIQVSTREKYWTLFAVNEAKTR